MRRPCLVLALGLVGLACACSLEADDGGNPFDAPATAPATLTAADDPQSDDDDENGDDDENDGETSTGDADDDGSEATTDPEPEPPDPGSSDSGDPTGVDETTGAGADPGAQPAEGMYSACAQPSDCVGVNLCVTIVDPMMAPLGGFCTAPGCANAAADCVATPGGTATPMCLPLTVNDMPDSACALDCAGGKTCPTGMDCLAITGGSICA